MKENRNKIEAMFFFFRQYPYIYVSLFLITIAYTLMESISLSLFFPIFKSVLGQQTAPNNFFRHVEKVIAILPFGDLFISACVLAIVLIIVKEALAFARQALIGYGTSNVLCDTKERIFNKYVNSRYRFFLDNKQGDLTYNMLGATAKLTHCLECIPALGAAISMMIMIGALLVIISPQATMLLVAIGISFNILTQLIAKKISYVMGKERIMLSREATVIANEFLDGIKHIKIFDSSEMWVNNFSKSVRRLKMVHTEDALWLAIAERAVYFLVPVIVIGMAFYFRHSYRTEQGLLLSNLASLGVYAFALLRLLPSLTSFGRLRMQIAGALPDVELLYRILKEERNSAKDVKKAVKNFRNDIRFENVSFSYKNKSDVLKGLNLIIEKGKRTAIVGSSGSGKSTLVNLVMRLFDPNEGRITIDGTDIQDMKYSSLAKMIGLVSQETFIFHVSIKENLVFGLKGVLFEEVVEAAKLANARDFIMSFPDGYETIVGDKGLKLSGGQRQRIAIARAILRNPQILILDEATSSLDHHSEVQVQQAINTASKNRTIIIIAHRLSSIIDADKIVVLNEGKIAEVGSHDELLKRDGLYRSLYEKQGVLPS